MGRAAPAVLAVLAVLVLVGAAAPPRPRAGIPDQIVRPALPNPTMAEACGIDVTLVLDASGSIASAGAVEDVRDAAEAFLVSLANTNSRARVIDFATNSRQTAPLSVVTTASLGQGGVFGQAIASYYNPKPPFPSGVNGHEFLGGSVTNPANFRAGSDTQ